VKALEGAQGDIFLVDTRQAPLVLETPPRHRDQPEKVAPPQLAEGHRIAVLKIVQELRHRRRF
jgi:hypothetical protein